MLDDNIINLSLFHLVLMLDIDWKIPFTCCTSCLGGITGSAHVSKSKQDAD